LSDHIQALINKKRQTMTTASCREILKPLKMCFRSLKQRRLVVENPVEYIEGIGKTTPAEHAAKAERWKRVPDAVIIARILNTANAHWTGEHAKYRTMVTVGFMCGLRRSELLGIRWSDVDWDKRTLHINQSVQRLKGGLVFLPPKTEGSAAKVALNDTAIKALREHQERQLTTGRIDGLVFPGVNGKPTDPRTLDDKFKALLRLAGLETQIRLHDVRHSAASRLIAEGEDLKRVSDFMRHSSIRVTADTKLT
jgi:integrase